MSKKIFDPTMGLEDTVQTLNRSKKSILNSKTKHGDPILSRAVSDTLKDSTESFWEPYYEAKNYSLESLVLEQYYENMRTERERDIRNARAIAKATGREDWEIWRSMEDMEDVKDFGKKAWETIKAAVKKLILMVINLIKSIGNFIKGAVAKAQEFFWKKYAAKVRSNAKAYVAKDSLTIKIRSKSPKELWVQAPDQTLVTLTKMVQEGCSKVIDPAIDQISNHQNVDVLGNLKKILTANPMFESMKNEAKKAFPSPNKIIFTYTYGVEKPGKNSVPVSIVIEKGGHLLEPGTLQKFQYAYKTGMMLNKTLEKQIKMIYKIEKKQAAGYGTRDERKDNLKEKGFDGGVDSFKEALETKRALHFISSLLISSYGSALSARIAVFSAARKLVKKGDTAKDTSENADEVRKMINIFNPEAPVGYDKFDEGSLDKDRATKHGGNESNEFYKEFKSSGSVKSLIEKMKGLDKNSNEYKSLWEQFYNFKVYMNKFYGKESWDNYVRYYLNKK